MDVNMIRAVLILCLGALTFASDVLELTDADFGDRTAQHDLLLVKFYAPWCGHCKSLAPEFDDAATRLKSNDDPVGLAKIDCTVETKTCEKYGVSGYPTLKIFRNGEFAEDYQGQRTQDDIVKVMTSKAGPSSKELSTLDEVEKFVAKDSYAVVAFLQSVDSDLGSAFKKLADSLSTDYRFAHTTSADARTKYGYDNNVVAFQPKHLHNKFEEAQQTFSDDATVFKMKKWVTAVTTGLAGVRTSANAPTFKQPLVQVYYDIDYTRNAKVTNYWRNRVLKVAQKFQDANKDISFSVSSKNDFAHEMTEMGLKSDSETPVTGIMDAKNRKYIMEDDFSMDNLEKFVNEYLDNKLEPYLKSEPIPETNDDPVKIVVAKNFDAIVNDETKDVLIEFYAPWCGHCKSLAPKYDELATKLENEKDIVIAKMDATANDVQKQYEVKGFPTIYYAPKGSKDAPKTYKGGREVDDFIKYLAAEATDELSGYTRDGKKKKKAKKEL